MTATAKDIAELARVQGLIACMRSNGVCHYRAPDGLELELGAEPAPARVRDRASDGERAEAAAEKTRRTMFAASNMKPRTMGQQLHEKYQRTKAMRT